MSNAHDEFIRIYNDNIHREGADKLLSWLESTDFFKAPASTRYHSCHEGGLCEHSLNVFHRLTFLVSDPSTKPTDETIAICGLLHDVCKANFYTVQMRNVKDESGHWVKKPYYAVDEKFAYGHGEKSVFLIERFMRLTIEEATAIRFHMGLTGDYSNNKACSAAFAKYPLAVMLHIADLEATYLDEKQL